MRVKLLGDLTFIELLAVLGRAGPWECVSRGGAFPEGRVS